MSSRRTSATLRRSIWLCEPLRRGRGAKLRSPLVPFLRASGVGFYTDNVETLEDEWVECLTERESSFRAAGLGGASKQQTSRYEIAIDDEIPTALEERGNLVGVGH